MSDSLAAVVGIPPKSLNRPRPIWGARAIGDYLGLTERQAFHLLEQGLLPGRKVGRRWASTDRALDGAVAPVEAA
jgi:hypothetical protein